MSAVLSFSATERKALTVVNITPLVDILLLLLIFFIVSAKFKNAPVIEINLPTASTSTEKTGPEIIITATKDGKIYYNRQPVIEPLLRTKLMDVESRDKRIVLRADRDLSVQRLIEFLDIFRELGFTNVSTVTISKRK